MFALPGKLVGQKTSKLVFQIGKLISAVSEKAFNDLISQYNKSLKDSNKDDLGNLRKHLSKVGLTYTENKIKIIDQYKWESFSKQKRAVFKIPSCTNQIESLYGLLKVTISRRNSFFS